GSQFVVPDTASVRVRAVALRRLGEEPAELAEAPQRPADAPVLIRRLGRVDVGENEVFDLPPAADQDLAVRIDHVAVAVADAVVLRDGRVPSGADVVAAQEVNAVLDGAGDVVGADLLEVAEKSFLGDIVIVRGEDDAGPFQGEDAAWLDVAAVGANHD